MAPKARQQRQYVATTKKKKEEGNLGDQGILRHRPESFWSLFLFAVLAAGAWNFLRSISGEAGSEKTEVFSQNKPLNGTIPVNKLPLGRQLLAAAARGQLAEVKAILAKPSSGVCGVDELGYTPVHLALQSRKVMLDSGPQRFTGMHEVSCQS